MPSTYQSLFYPKRNNVLCSLVKEAYRSLRYYGPPAASVAVQALGRLHEPPFSNTVLLLTVLPSIDRYTTQELLFLLEGLSLMDVSHAMLSAHVLKLFTRKVVRMCEDALRKQEKEHPLLAGKTESNNVSGSAMEATGRAPFQTCALYPVVGELSKVIVLLKTYHTESTLHAFLLSFTETIETHVFTQQSAVFLQYFSAVLLSRNCDVGDSTQGVACLHRRPALVKDEDRTRAVYVKQALFLLEATSPLVQSLPEPPFWLLCCLQDMCTDLSPKQLLHLYTTVWDNAQCSALRNTKEESEELLGDAYNTSASSSSHGPPNLFCRHVCHTYRHSICTRFMAMMPPSSSPSSPSNGHAYTRMIDPEAFPHLSEREKATLRRCVLSSLDSARDSCYPSSSTQEEYTEKTPPFSPNVTPRFLFELTQERVLAQCILNGYAEGQLKAATASEEEPLWERYLLSALSNIHNDTSSPHAAPFLCTDLIYIVRSMLLLLQQLYDMADTRSNTSFFALTVQQIVHRSSTLLHLLAHVLGKQQEFFQLTEVHLLYAVSTLLKGIPTTPTPPTSTCAKDSKKGDVARNNDNTSLLKWVCSHLVEKDALAASFIQECALVASLVARRWASDVAARKVRRVDGAATTCEPETPGFDTDELVDWEKRIKRARRRVSEEKMIEAVISWRAMEEFACALVALMHNGLATSQACSFPHATTDVHFSTADVREALLGAGGGANGIEAAANSEKNFTAPYFCQIFHGLLLSHEGGAAFLSLLDGKSDCADDPHRRELVIRFVHTLHTVHSMLSIAAGAAVTGNDAQWVAALRDTMKCVLRSTEFFAVAQFVRRQVELFGVYWTGSSSSDSALGPASGESAWSDIAQQLLLVCYESEVHTLEVNKEQQHLAAAATLVLQLLLLPETIAQLELLLHFVLQWHPFFRSSRRVVNQCQRIRAQRGGEVYLPSVGRCTGNGSSTPSRPNDQTTTASTSFAHFAVSSEESSTARSGPQSRGTTLYQRSLYENLSLASILPSQGATLENRQTCSPPTAYPAASSASSSSSLLLAAAHRRQHSRPVGDDADVHCSVVEVLLHSAKGATWSRFQAGHTLAHVYGLSSGWQRHLPLIEKWWHTSRALRCPSTHLQHQAARYRTAGGDGHGSGGSRHPFVQMCVRLWGARTVEGAALRAEVPNTVGNKRVQMCADPLRMLRWYDVLQCYSLERQQVLQRLSTRDAPVAAESAAMLAVVGAGGGVVVDAPLLPLRALLMRYRILAALWVDAGLDEAQPLPLRSTEVSHALVEKTVALLTSAEGKLSEQDRGEEHFVTQKREVKDEIETLTSFLHAQLLPYCVADILTRGHGSRHERGRLASQRATQTLDYVLGALDRCAPFPADKAPLLTALEALRDAAADCTPASSRDSPSDGRASLHHHCRLSDSASHTNAPEREEVRAPPRSFLREVVSRTMTLQARERGPTFGQVAVEGTEEAAEDRLFFLFSSLLLGNAQYFKPPSRVVMADPSISPLVAAHMSAQLATAVHLFTLVHTYDPMWPFYRGQDKTRCLQAIRKLILQAVADVRLPLGQQQWLQTESIEKHLKTIEEEVLALFS